MKPPILLATLLILPLLPFQLALPTRAAEDYMTGDVAMTVLPTNVQPAIKVPGGSKRINLSFRNMALADALRALAKQGGFNVVIDESVEGEISTDLKDITIQDALNILKYQGKLAYGLKGNTLMAAAADTPKGQSFERTVSQIIPLKYANAAIIANLLNNSAFAATPGSGSTSSGNATAGSSATPPKVIPDFRTNSLIVMGTPADLQAASEYAKALDVPRESKTWRLSHANALDVSSILASSLFNDGRPRMMLSSGGGSSSAPAGGNALGNAPSSLRVRAENLKEGQGSLSQNGGGSGGGSSGGSGGGSTSAGLNTNITLRTLSKEDQTAQIYPDGAILIPDTRMNTVTLFGTAEQIAMAESFIANLDRKAPQVVLETALIEINSTQDKQVGMNTGGTRGRFGFGVNNTQSSGTSLFNNAYSKAVGLATPATNPFLGLFRYNSSPVVKTPELTYQLNALLSTHKAKVLAHPTITTISDNEAVISIVDEIIKSVTVTLDRITGATQGTQANIGEAGIVLNILPKVGMDQTVSMRIRPTVSSVKQTITDTMQNIVTLVSKREALAQEVVLKDGESFVLGGLIQDTDTNQVSKIPGVGDLPIVGALARSSIRNKNRTELVVVVTPHILPADDSMPAAMHNMQTGYTGEVLQHSAEMKQLMPSASPQAEASSATPTEDVQLQAIGDKFKN